MISATTRTKAMIAPRALKRQPHPAELIDNLLFSTERSRSNYSLVQEISSARVRGNDKYETAKFLRILAIQWSMQRS